MKKTLKKTRKAKKLVIPQSFIYPEILPEHRQYTFGSENAGDIIRENGDWRDYLPPEEDQRKRGVESSACYIYAQLGTLADILEEEFGIKDSDFAERFNALLSDGTASGGDPLKGADSIRRDGVIPESMMPFSEAIKSWNDFHSWLETNIKACVTAGKLWLKRWKPNNYIVFEKEDSIEYKYAQLREALKRSTVPMSVFPTDWNKEGEHKKPKGARDTHMVRCVYLDEKNRPYWRDTYPPYLKIGEPFYNSDFALRWTIQPRPQDQSFWDKLKELFGIIKVVRNDIPRIEPAKEPTLQEKLHKIMSDALNTDPTPDDKTPDDVACAETLSTLLKRLYTDFPVLPSTKDLDGKLFLDKRFERIMEPEKGCLVVSPRTTIVNGHCGYFLTGDRIASNDSKTGLFRDNYSWQSWIKEFKTKRKLNIYMYKII